MTKCPTCHGSGSVPDGFKMTTTATRPILFRSREKDQRTVDAVDIPFKQSLAGGGFVSIVCGSIAALSPWDVWPQVALLAGSVTGLGIWWWATSQDKQRVWWRLENLLGVDLTGDNIIGEPAPAPHTKETLLPVHDANRKSERERIEVFIRDCETKDTALNYWVENRKLKRETYTEWRDLLIRLRWAGWVSKKSRNQGWGLLSTADEIITGMFRGGTRPPHPPGMKRA